MYSPILWALALLCSIVWIIHNMVRPFGWCSSFKVSHHYVKHLNGARYEILLIKWRRRASRQIEALVSEIAKANHAFARDIDMLALLEEMDLPSGMSIYSMLPDGRIAAIDTFPLRKDHVRRTADFICTGDHDAYAVVSQELIDTREPTHVGFNTPKKGLTVA